MKHWIVPFCTLQHRAILDRCRSPNKLFLRLQRHPWSPGDKRNLNSGTFRSLLRLNGAKGAPGASPRMLRKNPSARMPSPASPSLCSQSFRQPRATGLEMHLVIICRSPSPASDGRDWSAGPGLAYIRFGRPPSLFSGASSHQERRERLMMSSADEPRLLGWAARLASRETKGLLTEAAEPTWHTEPLGRPGAVGILHRALHSESGL